MILLNNTGLQQRDQKLYDFLKRLLDGANQISNSVASIEESSSSGVTNITQVVQQLQYSDLGSDSENLMMPPGASSGGGSSTIGATGPAVFLAADRGEDGEWIPGPKGDTGASASLGNSNPLIALDGNDGEDGLTIPGPTGATGASGASGNNNSIPIFLPGDDGEDGMIGPPGEAGSNRPADSIADDGIYTENTPDPIVGAGITGLTALSKSAIDSSLHMMLGGI